MMLIYAINGLRMQPENRRSIPVFYFCLRTLFYFILPPDRNRNKILNKTDSDSIIIIML